MVAKKCMIIFFSILFGTYRIGKAYLSYIFIASVRFTFPAGQYSNRWQLREGNGAVVGYLAFFQELQN